MRLTSSFTSTSPLSCPALSPASSALLGCLCLCLSLGAACASIPDAAPQEYHLADAAIERAEDIDADDVFPDTIDRAKAELKQALNLYDQSQDEDASEPTRAAVAKAGSEKAIEARGLADKATELYTQVEAWDRKIELKEEGEKSAEALATLQNRVALMEEEASRQAQAEERRSQLQANMKSPVVFFKTNDVAIDAKFNENVNSLATTLKSNPQLKVTLVGYADRTGAMAHNQTLSEQRAESVAQSLRAKGVSAEQINISFQGASMASASPRNQAGRQLDRRVDAVVSGRSNSDEMTTGR